MNYKKWLFLLLTIFTYGTYEIWQRSLGIDSHSQKAYMASQIKVGYYVYMEVFYKSCGFYPRRLEDIEAKNVFTGKLDFKNVIKDCHGEKLKDVTHKFKAYDDKILLIYEVRDSLATLKLFNYGVEIDLPFYSTLMSEYKYKQEIRAQNKR